jgi:hypothetical protein
MPFLMSFALEPEIVTLAWIDNASVQFPLNIYATKRLIATRRPRSTHPDNNSSHPWDGQIPPANTEANLL